jgi:hypothetical protein
MLRTETFNGVERATQNPRHRSHVPNLRLGRIVVSGALLMAKLRLQLRTMELWFQRGQEAAIESRIIF